MSKRFAGWFCLLSLSIFFGAISVAYSLQIVYPVDGTYVQKSNYLILKGGRAPYLDGMSIGINGVMSEVIDLSAEEYRSYFADMLKVEPLFDSGENKLVVEGYVDGEKVTSSEATIYYLDDPGKSPPAGYVKEVFHLAEREGPCAECHYMQPTVGVLAEQGSSPCASCHKRMLNENHVHGPAGVFECLFCHDADSSPVKYSARTGDALVCYECHDDKGQSFGEQSFIHGPVEAGMCLVCHDPHASKQPAQLVEKVNTLCLSCHARIEGAPHVTSGTSEESHPLEGPASPLNPQKAFNCSSCHDPHGGKHSNYFVDGITARMQLCSICHSK